MSYIISEIIKNYMINQHPVKVWEMEKYINADKIGIPGYELVKTYRTVQEMNENIYRDFDENDDVVAKHKTAAGTNDIVYIKIYRKEKAVNSKQEFLGKQDQVNNMADDVSNMAETIKKRGWESNEGSEGTLLPETTI